MLARIRKAREEGDSGFTLIELLVVIIIIGILAAIAIPTFLNQREKAWKKAAISDLRNAATKMEEYFDDNGTYAGATPALFKSSGNDAGTSDVTLTIATADHHRLLPEREPPQAAGRGRLPPGHHDRSPDDGRLP